MVPKILSLDAGGTLIFPHPSVGAVYGEVLEKQGLSIPFDTLNQRFGPAFREALAQETRNLPPFSQEFWRWIVLRVIQPELSDPQLQEQVFQEAYERFGRGSSWRLAEGIKPVLEALHQKGVPLVVFSNNDPRLEQVLQDLGVASLFDAILVSTRLGFRKPDPRAFRAVENALRATPRQITHIGDSLENDGLAPQRAGWRSYLAPGNSDPEKRISTLPNWDDLLAKTLVRNPIQE